MSAAFKRPILAQTTASLSQALTLSEETEHGPKGGLLILMKNIYPAAEINRSGDEDTEILGIKVMIEGNPLSIYNLYSPPPKALQLHAIQLEEERWIIMGDFQQPLSQLGIPGS